MTHGGHSLTFDTVLLVLLNAVAWLLPHLAEILQILQIVFTLGSIIFLIHRYYVFLRKNKRR